MLVKTWAMVQLKADRLVTCWGFELARRGYHVWLANSRGNFYSQKHLSLDSKSREFWAFSQNEQFLHDTPAVIDHVLKYTNSSKLAYVGHSQGTQRMFALLSVKPKYNEIIKPFVVSNLR